MKIAISGPHGTGKTTLVESLKTVLRCPIISEGAREIAAYMGFKNVVDIPDDLFDFFEHSILWYKFMLERFSLSFIADRGIFECVPYYEARTKSSEAQKTLFKLMALKNSAHYDYIFYTPIEFELKADGFRHSDIEFQKKIDVEIRAIIKKYLSNIPFYELKGTNDEKVVQIEEVLWKDQKLIDRE